MKPYQPSNGTEGIAFIEEYCMDCIKDNEENEIFCPILTKTFVSDVNDDDYPKEWICDDDGKNPRCTAFTTEEELIIPQDTETMNLFGDEQK